MTELVKLDAEVIQGEYLLVMWDIWRDLSLHIPLAAIRISYLPKMESVVILKNNISDCTAKKHRKPSFHQQP
jgi:hypothetical protein